jgi:hypothetical protein
VMPLTKPSKLTARFFDRQLKQHVEKPVTVQVDWQSLADQFAPKAYANKAGRSVQCNGAIVVQVA